MDRQTDEEVIPGHTDRCTGRQMKKRSLSVSVPKKASQKVYFSLLNHTSAGTTNGPVQYSDTEGEKRKNNQEQ